jgi:hypothetical protein
MVGCGYFLDLFIEECPFYMSGGVPKHMPIFFCSLSLVCGQTLRTVFIPPWLGVARDVGELSIILEHRHNASMQDRREEIEFGGIRRGEILETSEPLMDIVEESSLLVAIFGESLMAHCLLGQN